MTERIETRDDWARARDAFLDLVELDAPSRIRELELLARSDPALRDRVAALLAHDRPEPAAVPPAPRFGPYEPVRLLGSGGMGEVWLARRADGEYEREVAIKVMRASIGGDELVRRFLRERQTLASLDHEYIGRLLDGGTTEGGLPYLVLEYVEGIPLDRYCREMAFGVPQRLRLFIKVLSAVAHAHERGIIHRDLKPGNILVRPDGTPRLLDFGISRIRAGDEDPSVAPLTRAGHRLFTPEYASPEQFGGGEVAETSDVFALGVVLHQLLTGERPWPKGLDDVALERAVIESAAPPPSRCVEGTARRQLAGDLDTIVEKCLRKEPWCRYAHVVDIISDLERHLAGEPIQARRTGRFERVVRRAKRHPGITVAAAVSVLAAGWVVKLVHDERAGRRELVRTAAARLDGAIALRQQGQFDESVAELKAVIATLEPLPGTASLRARAHTHIAIGANHGKEFDEALRHAAAAEPLIDRAAAESGALLGSLLNARAYALFRGGQSEAARQAADAALAHCRAHLPPGDPRTIDALVEIADQRRSGPPTAEDFANIDAVVEEARNRGDPRDSTLGSALNLAAMLRSDGFRYEEAVKLLQDAIDVLRWHHGEGHEAIALLRSNLGDQYFRLGRFPEAAAEHGRALEARRALGNPGNIAVSLEYLARVALDSGDLTRAESLLAEKREIVAKELGESHTLARRCRLWTAILAVERGDVATGRAELEALLARHGSAPAMSAEHEAQARFRLGRVRIAAGELESGRVQVRTALRVFEQVLGPAHRDTIAARALADG